MRKAIDLVGESFGYLTVESRAEGYRYGPRWLCRCVCGKAITVLGSNLRSRKTTHCGCKHEEIYKLRKTKAVFYSMHCRCETPKAAGYVNYGGRGISVCERWENTQQGFNRFIEDMGPAPAGKSIERLDNDGDYSPENCVWAAHKDQARNKRTNRMIEFRGRTQCITAWAEEYKIHPGTLISRLNAGWPLERALTAPVRKKRTRPKRKKRSLITLEYNGERKTIREWSETTGLSYNVIRDRYVSLGWSAERTITEPLHTEPPIERLRCKREKH